MKANTGLILRVCFFFVGVLLVFQIFTVNFLANKFSIDIDFNQSKHVAVVGYCYLLLFMIFTGVLAIIGKISSREFFNYALIILAIPVLFVVYFILSWNTGYHH